MERKSFWWASNAFGGVDLEYFGRLLVGAETWMRTIRTCSESEFRELFARWCPDGDVSEYVRRVDLTEVLGRGVLARRLYELASSGSIPGVVALPPLPAQARDACLYRLMQAKYRKPYYRAKLMNSPEVDGLLRLVYLSEKNVS